MTEMCQDPLRYLVERLCCQVYLDGGGNIRLGFSRRHDLKDMMTAQGIAHSNARVLRDRLRRDGAAGQDGASRAAEAGVGWAERLGSGEFCPLV
ncbi:MAG: hypothetical protein ACP59X_05325 [Solidesulfovibrio sp. DCME]|uniref:hypothetical protein n=1 Tax=Solidesulfovibrio sp. DCME TaxID=3447380 RepID=UPI003D0BE44F